jgi:hypothetical protein
MNKLGLIPFLYVLQCALPKNGSLTESATAMRPTWSQVELALQAKPPSKTCSR